jgi:ferredoxin
MNSSLLVLVIWAITFFGTSTNSFVVIIPECNHRRNRHQSLLQRYGWMDAFKNDETLGKPQNAGLKNGPNYNEQVTVNGNNVPNAVVGQKLTVVASRVRVKIPVNCQKGDCGTCMVNLNGRKVKACQTSLPAGKVSITTL